MIDVKKAYVTFKKYIGNYDLENERINLKVIHTYHVAKTARMLAKELSLSIEQQDLAEVIGLLHDIGRFEQVRLYDTFNDRLSVDHASKGLEVLYANQFIRSFVSSTAYDSIIYKSIENHNKLKLGRGLSEEELLFCKIIRDADNIDIFRGLLDQKLENFGQIGTDDISKEVLSPYFYESFSEERLLEYSKAKTDMDIMVAIITHIFDLEFNLSLKIIKDNDYIRKMVKKLNCQDSYTKEKMEKIVILSDEYISKRLGDGS